MPTAKRRILFTPSPRALEAIDRLAVVSGRSRAGIVSDQIDALVEHIDGLARACEIVAQINEEGQESIRLAANAAAGAVAPKLAAVDEAWRSLLQLIDAADKSDRKPPAYNMGATTSYVPDIPHSGKAA